jgi:membrane protease YdiL (CAAX protease family)
LLALYFIFSAAARIRPIRAAKLDKLPRPWWIFFVLPVIVLLCLYATIPALTAYDDLLTRIGYGTSELFEAVDIPLDLSTPGGVIFYTVTVAVMPAICEELLFRGVVLNGLKHLGAVPAVVLSAALFMLFHQNPQQVIHQFVLGLILGYVVLRTGSIWTGVLVHFTNNFIALFAEHMIIFDFEEPPLWLSYAAGWLAILVFVLAAWLAIDAMCGKFRQNFLVRLFTREKDPDDLKARTEYAADTVALYERKRMFVPLLYHDPSDPAAREWAFAAADTEHNRRTAASERSKRTWAIVTTLVAVGIYALLWTLALFIGIYPERFLV